jgi:dihydropteroate synthase
MGIVNVTPDSFFDGAHHDQPEQARAHGLRLAAEGADILDLGGESTRPGSTPATEDEERQRVGPALRRLLSATTLPISIDTTKAIIAAESLCLGACIVNDIWGLQGDPDMARVVGEHHAAVVVMHNQHGTDYPGDIIAALRDFFRRSLDIAARHDIRESSIVLDPGIGFGKTPAQNLELLRRLDELHDLGFPLLLGASRKSFIGKVLDLPPPERLEGTLASTTLAVAQGVAIVRVHDVQANLRAARTAEAILHA